MTARTNPLTAILRAATLGLGFATLAGMAAWPGAARADNSRGQDTKALVAAIPGYGTGWSNGPTTLVPLGGGKYQLDYDTALASNGSLARPGVPVVVGNLDGNPIIERQQPAR